MQALVYGVSNRDPLSREPHSSSSNQRRARTDERDSPWPCQLSGDTTPKRTVLTPTVVNEDLVKLDANPIS